MSNLTLKGGNLSLKALLVGVILSVAVSYAVVYLEMVVGWQVAILQFPPIAVGVLFLLVLLNMGAKAILRKAPLKAADIVIIYTMVCIASLISNRNQTGIFTITLPSPNYFADAANNWRERLFPLIKPWLVPFDVMKENGEPGPVRQLVVRRYFEGLKEGEMIPWADWAVPLLLWGILHLSMLFAFLFMASILRRPWVEAEKLVFPFTLVPIQLSREESFREFFRSRLAWAGFSLPVVIYTVNLIHANFPSFPELKLDWGSIRPMLTTWPWVLLDPPPFWLSLGATGIAYFLPGDFIFSFWFFCWFYRFQWVAVNAFGVAPPDHSHYRFGIEGGAYCALAFLLLRSLWRQLKAMGEGKEELLSLRWALLGLGVCIFVGSLLVWAMG
ncbi:MAG TPA: hypothetical protein EYP65_08175, partial [Armatimonadetes bacterium]|nr:hypothetical protein [Armatimonadota bacterium]